ncbi:MAG: methyltransferase domain-containing protein [Anaerolineales bacterium]|nr:methyltransferase domain-containing protein [Anaerolineales bacterium]
MLPLLICHLRPARRKARDVAVLEALCLLRDLQPVAPNSGPLAEQGGVFWIEIPGEHLEVALDRLPLLGYTIAVDVLEEVGPWRKKQRAEILRWRKRDYWPVRVYEEDAEAARESAPDRRTFVLESQGHVREVKGYRGDSGPLSRRGLPAYDARLLVNLVTPAHGRHVTFLDPFAGVGGLLLEARAHGWVALSGDVDARLRFGLSACGSAHAVFDASRLPLADESLDAAATEPPYAEVATEAVSAAVHELARVLKPGARLALLVAAHQAGPLREAAAALPLRIFLDSPINRKGVECVALAWEKAP